MRYLGSKIKLLPHIESIIKKYKIEGTTFADLFAGTSCVGDYFKEKYKIIANDFLYYSYVISKAKLSFKKIPKFKGFKDKYGKDIFEWFNNKRFKPDDTFFVYKNYTPVGGRNFFTEKNGIKIDGIRKEIEKLFTKGVITENEYYFLLASLLESVTKVSNTSGTYEAFFKFIESRAEKELVIEPIEMNITKKINNNIIYQEDTNQLVRKIEGDIAYIDTPYTVTQYVSAYHILETLAKYDNPKITGIGGKRNRENKNSLYARRNEAKSQFEDLFRQLNFKHIIISYSNQGLVPLDELVDLAKLFAKDGKVFVEKFNYQEYQNHRSSNKRNGENLNEVIIYFEKDNEVNKSPLNYSGSKDTLVPKIIKELPCEVENFVDVMGGAFNVGANIVSTKNVYYNEIKTEIYYIIKWILLNNKNKVIKDVEQCIKKYKLDKGAKEAFNKLRDDYNKDNDCVKLFVLHMYSFQNMIRFNNSKQFNTPIGVAGYSEDLKNRIMNFMVKSPKLFMTNLDYINIEWDKFSKKTVFYFDPPYYITSASYNDGKRGGKGWSIKEEKQLLRTLKKLDRQGYKFILSNVIKHKNKEHTLLIDWVNKNKFKMIDAGISGWRYAKNEVIIKNF